MWILNYEDMIRKKLFLNFYQWLQVGRYKRWVKSEHEIKRIRLMTI